MSSPSSKYTLGGGSAREYPDTKQLMGSTNHMSERSTNEHVEDSKAGGVVNPESGLRTFSNVAVTMTEKAAISAVAGEEDQEVRSKPVSGAFFPSEIPWIINPKCAYMRKWDVVMLVLLLFTALITPYEVAFMQTGFNFLFFVNRFVDVLFFKDLIMNFFVAQLDDIDGTWVVNHRTLACRYLSAWFTIDFVSILPFDTIGLVMDSKTVNQLKILRVVRLFRLFKLFRIFRASRIFSRWESHISISYSWLSLTKFMVSVAAVSHWLACFWRLTVDIEDNIVFGQPVNWMTEYDYVSSAQYITALYWSVMTLTTIGYGDVAPVTLGEQCLCIFAMLLGGSIYAYVIGAVCGIVSSMDEATTAYHKTMDELNIFMVENKLPVELRVRLREYFQHCRQLQRAQHYQDLLVHMSPMLRGEVAVFCNREWVLKVPFFNGAPVDETNNFITSIALALKLEAYAPHETIIKKGEPTEKMYIIQRGVVSRLGHVFSSGACVGEDMILKDAKRTSDVRALTYVDVSGLHRDRLLAIVNRGHFPVISKIIRNAAIRMALRREFIHYAESIAAIRGRKPLGRTLTDKELLGTKLRNGQALSGLAHTPRALVTASQRALSVESMGSASASNRGFNNKRLTGISGRMGRQGSPLAAAPVRAVEHSDDDEAGDINLLQASVDVSPNKAQDDAATIADAEFKRVIADAERELGLPGKDGRGGDGFRRSSLLDKITSTRRGARRSLDGLDNAPIVPSSPVAVLQESPPAQRHAAEEAAGTASRTQGRYLPAIASAQGSGAGPITPASMAAAGRRLSTGRGTEGDDAAADAAGATPGQRALMKLITQRCNHVERLVESSRVALLHRMSDVDKRLDTLEAKATKAPPRPNVIPTLAQAAPAAPEPFLSKYGVMVAIVSAQTLLLLVVLIVQH